MRPEAAPLPRAAIGGQSPLRRLLPSHCNACRHTISCWLISCRVRPNPAGLHDTKAIGIEPATEHPEHAVQRMTAGAFAPGRVNEIGDDETVAAGSLQRENRLERPRPGNCYPPGPLFVAEKTDLQTAFQELAARDEQRSRCHVLLVPLQQIRDRTRGEPINDPGAGLQVCDNVAAAGTPVDICTRQLDPPVEIGGRKPRRPGVDIDRSFNTAESAIGELQRGSAGYSNAPAGVSS